MCHDVEGMSMEEDRSSSPLLLQFSFSMCSDKKNLDSSDLPSMIAFARDANEDPKLLTLLIDVLYSDNISAVVF